MKKAIYNNKGRQVVNSDWAEFNKQTNCISTGNVYANTQMSSFIRPYKKTECNGFQFPEGHLMNTDLKQFSGYKIPYGLEQVIKDKNREDSVILYMFFTLRNGHVVPFGWVLTDGGHHHIGQYTVRRYNESYTKRWSALNEAIQYITE